MRSLPLDDRGHVAQIQTSGNDISILNDERPAVQGGILAASSNRHVAQVINQAEQDLTPGHASTRFSELRTTAETTSVSIMMRQALSTIHKSPADLYPPNKITAYCSSCRTIIPRFEGYRHINIGDKKTFCPNCHKNMGLPLRTVEIDANHG